MTTREQSAVVRAHLLTLCEKAKGTLTADQIVAEATRKSSPLHPLFEWDNEKAGHAHRLDQARELMRGIQVRYETRHEIFDAPVFCRNPNTTRGYTLVSSVRNDRDHARQVLLREFIAARGALERAKLMAHALGLAGDIDKLLEGILEVHRVAEGAALIE